MLRFCPAQIEQWPVARLLPYARNARTHSEAQVAKLAASLVEFGWTAPVLVADDGAVIAGHGRLLAARQLGLDAVPVIRLSHLTAEQVRAYRIADNRLALDAGWDEELLAAELQDLAADGFDLDLTGFEGAELDRLLASLDDAGAAAAESNAVPALPAEPITRPGELWRLGEHRLLCGDATRADDVGRLLEGARPGLMVTDPPYGVGYDPAWRNAAGVSSSRRTGKVRNDDRADWREAWALFPGDVAYVWHAGVHAKTVAESLEACGFVLRAQLIWVKSRFVLGRGHYHWQHEPCFYAVRQGGEARWQGARDQSTVWHIGGNGEDDAQTVHGTQKPVACMLRPMLNNSARGDGVYEPFAGSGSTLIAAESCGRQCLAMEIEPAYCDVIVTRWQNRSGQPAILDGDGRSFAELAAERRQKGSSDDRSGADKAMTCSAQRVDCAAG
ncbi:MAG: site-specific DNA-methyltransferase [Rhodospirillales bacterium]|nr:site-specific DNA-methyltransferase [Rhodospirillales bacterium]